MPILNQPELLQLGITLPGEALAVAIIEGITENRRTMSQENRDRFDALTIKSLEEGNKFWSLVFSPFLKALEKIGDK